MANMLVQILHWKSSVTSLAASRISARLYFFTIARLPSRFFVPSSSTYGSISRVVPSASVVFGFVVTSKEMGNSPVYCLLPGRSLARFACVNGCFQSNEGRVKAIDTGDISAAYVTLPWSRSCSSSLASHASFSQSGVRDTR